MEIVTEGKLPEIPASEGAHGDGAGVSPADIGLAVDVGTTTVVVTAWAIATRKNIATVAEKNNQIRFGYDVVRRVACSMRPDSATDTGNGFSVIHYCIVSQLEKMFTKAVNAAAHTLVRGFRPHISAIVITGNTCMLSFLAGVSVKHLARVPFRADSKFDFFASWNAVRYGNTNGSNELLGAPPPDVSALFQSSIVPGKTAVYFPPCVGAFIGADAVCAMIAAGMPVPGAPGGACTNRLVEAVDKNGAPILVVDIGTNSEMALYIAPTPEKPGHILCTSAAAGPAFEAANIACGMPSIEGAIDKIEYQYGKFSCRVIGGGAAKGICGSGLVSGLSVLFENGLVDKNGVIVRGGTTLGDGTACIELTPAVYISQQDIRSLQLAKSAVRTGLEYLLERSPTLPVLCIAGGFGSKLSVSAAVKIGLIPEELRSRTIKLGNAALSGAAALLFSKTLRQKGRDLAKASVQVNLAAIPEFQDEFLGNMEFLETTAKEAQAAETAELTAAEAAVEQASWDAPSESEDAPAATDAVQ